LESKSDNLKSKLDEWQADHPRIDLREKVSGQAQYIEDLPDLPQTAYGATLLSPYSHARILSIDSSEAEGCPGVLAVFEPGTSRRPEPAAQISAS